MYSDLECGICYRTYNASRRCPRELHCRHSFCESCLLALSRTPGSDEGRPGAERSIVCPLCRQTTSISGERKMRAELRVDESALERLMESGVLDQEEEEEEEEEEEDPEVEVDGQVQSGCEDDDDEGATLPETPAEERDSSAVSRGGRLRRSWNKVWRKISGKSSRQSGGQTDCMTSDDLRNLAMMSCYMF